MSRRDHRHAPRSNRRRPIGRVLLATMSVLVATIGAIPTPAPAFDDPISTAPADSDARILFGEVTGMAPNFGFDGFGQALQIADVNSDGADDVVVMQGNGETDGVISIYLGSPGSAFTDIAERVTANLVGEVGVTAPGPEITITDGGLGGDFVVADFDGSGSSEIAAVDGAGNVIVFDVPAPFGSYEIGVNLTATQTIDGPGFPSALAIGNLDVDTSTDDLVIGFPDADQVDIHFGGSLAGTAVADVEITGPATSHFGAALATGPVIGLGGLDDLLIGAPRDTPGSNATGVVYGFDEPGLAGGPLSAGTAEFRAVGDEGDFVAFDDYTFFGAAVAIADVTGSAGLDLVVGSPGLYDDDGAVYVIAGPVSPGQLDSPVLQRWSPTQTAAAVGRELLVGDINGDGLDDVIAGGSDSVYVWEHSAPAGADPTGSPREPFAFEGWRFDGASGSGLGRALAISESGPGFLAIGAPGTDTNVVEETTNAGAVELFDLTSGGRTFVVNSTSDSSEDVIDGLCDDGGTCTLRGAIQEANFVGAATIEFGITGTGPFVIDVGATPLPEITVPVTIDGLTQLGNPGDPFAPGGISLGLNYTGTSPLSDGLRFAAGSEGSSVRGLAISGFTGSAISVDADDVLIEQSRLGVRPADAAGDNLVGVTIQSGVGTTTIDGNLISNNTAAGIDDLGNGALITNNRIGTNLTGTQARPNGVGINKAQLGFGFAATVVADNVISGNTGNGIQAFIGDIRVRGNRIGIGLDDGPLGNGGDGFHGEAAAEEFLFMTIGAEAPPTDGNIIAFNQGSGVVVTGDESGTITASIEGNVISGNQQWGIDHGLSFITVRKNRIGVAADGSPLGNAAGGIIVSPVADYIEIGATIGSTDASRGNTIAHNGGVGVSLETSGLNDVFTPIVGNSIFDNDGLGIDLVSNSDPVDGVTLNDPDDSDLGPNELLNYPVLGAVSVFDNDGELALDVEVDTSSFASGNYRLEFFASDSCDPTGFGEGAAYLGSRTFSTASFDGTAVLPLSAVPGSANVLTATSTVLIDGVSGWTSEFSECVSLFGPIDAEVDSVSLAVDSPSTGPGVTSIPIADIPIEAVLGAAAAADAEAAPLGAVPLSAVSLSASPLGAVPLTAVPLTAVPLGAVPLGAVPVDFPGGWPALLEGTEFEGQVPQAITLQQLLESDSISGTSVETLPLGAVDLTDTPLGAVPLTAVVLGSTDVGSTPLSAVPLTAVVLAGAPLGAVPLTAVPLTAVPLTAVPLGAVPLTAVPLGAVPLTAVEIAGTPLSAVEIDGTPLGAVPLTAVDLDAVPLGAVPLTAVEIQGSPLGAVPLGAVSSGTSTGCELLAGFAPDCVDLGIDDETTLFEFAVLLEQEGSSLAASPLGAVPLTAVPLTAVEINDATIDTLADLFVGTDLSDLPPEVLDALTVADILAALVITSDYPWEELDFVDLGIQDFVGTATEITYTAAVQVSGEGQVVVSATLPPQYRYRSGSTSLFNEIAAGPFLDPIIDDAATGQVLTWFVPAADGNNDLEFDVSPGFTLGTQGVDIQATGANETGSQQVNAALHTITAPTDPTTTSEDTLQLGWLTAPAETDLYEITTPGPGFTTSVFLNHFSEDTDLVLYRPTNAPPAAGGGETADAPTTQVVEDDGFGRIGSAEPETLGDALTTPGQTVVESSSGRGIADEEATDYRSEAATTYSIQVNGYNGATSDEPYILRVKFTEDQVIPACPATGFLENNVATTTPLPADLETIIVFDQGRMEAIYGVAGANDVLAGAQSLVNFLNNSADFGDAAILFTDGLTDYSAWDSNPCDWQAADAIAKAIRAELVDYAVDNESLRYVTILGDDDVIPFHRQVDATSYANEDSYAAEFAGNALFGSLSTRHILTDHPYGDPDPIPWLDRFLYLPEISVGRLLETPAEIETAIDTFITFNGQLDPAATALVTGYDFLTDGATDTATALNDNGITTESIIDDSWTDDTLEEALLVPDGPEFVSANAHFDYYRALPASENLAAESTYGPATLFQADEVLNELDTNPAFSLEGNWLFTMGCHAGLSVSDVAIGSSPDWAQTWSGNGGIFTGNTGFGYGDTVTVALTEELVVGLAEGLDGSLTIGQATVNSLQNYYARAGLYGVYDEKVIQQFTTYGLPMYQVGGDGAAPIDPPEPTVSTDPFTGQPSAPVSTGTVAVSATGSNKGTVYNVDGQTLEIHYRPIQPMTSIDVTVEGLVARGAIITDWKSTDVTETDIAFSRPVIDDGDAEPEIENPNSVFPSTFAAVANYERPSTTPGSRTERRQNLNLIVGQYNAPLQRQRLFDDIEVDVLYVDPASPFAEDDTAAVIEQVQASIVGPPDGRTVGFIVDVADTTPAARVVVLYRSDLPGAQWRKAELVSGSPWSGGGPIDDGTTEVEYVVQVARANGLVSVSSSKGTFHQAVDAPPPPDNTPALTVALDGSIPGGTWYTGPVTVTLSGSGGPFDVTVDGASVTPNTNGEFTISDDGVHQVVVTGSNGMPQSFGVPIDQTSPQIEFGTPELIEFGTEVAVDFECRDAGSGVIACDSSVPSGTPIDTTVAGSAGSVTVTSTDVAGNPTTTRTLDYTVGAAPDVTLTVNPIDAFIGDTVTATVTVGGTVEPDSVQIDWGDGTIEVIDDTTATHTYGSDGTFDVVASVTFGTTTIESGSITVEVQAVVEPEIEFSIDPTLVAVDDQVTATITVLAGSLDSTEIDWGDGTVETISGTTATHTYDTAGIYTVTAVSTFAGGETVTDSVDDIVVYDPRGQAIVGAGWFRSPTGSSADVPTARGYTSFIFSSRYWRSTSTEPAGYLLVNFRAAGLKFTATHWDWLVAPGDDTAIAEGTGTIRNRSGDVRFRLEVEEGRYVWGIGWQRAQLRFSIVEDPTGGAVYDSGWVDARGFVSVYTPWFRR